VLEYFGKIYTPLLLFTASGERNDYTTMQGGWLLHYSVAPRVVCAFCKTGQRCKCCGMI